MMLKLTNNNIDADNRYSFETSDQGLIYLDATGTVSSSNLAAEQLLGIQPNALIGRKLVDCWPTVIKEDGLFLSHDQHPSLKALQTGKAVKDVILGLFNSIKRNYIWINVSSIPEFKLGDRQPCRIMMTLTDITSQKMAEVRLSMAPIIVNNIGEAIFVTDKDKKIISINKAFTKLTGFTHQDVFGKSAYLFQSDKYNKKNGIDFNYENDSISSWQGEVWRHHKYDGDFPSWTTINEIKDENNQLIHYIYEFINITHLNKTHNHLSFLAYHDPLTKLPNRLLVKDRITHALQNAKREGSKVAVLFLDLDRFKTINDIYGHDVGDLLLIEAAARIKNMVRKEDTVCRYAGDEFIVFMENIPDIKNPATLAQKLIDSFKAPVYIDKHRLHISTSMGISLFPSDGGDAETLIKNADAAMYRAKKEGRNNYQYYSLELTTETSEKLALEKALRQSMIKGELLLHYQPQVCLKTGKLVGVKSLVRWNHPAMGLLSAMRFIPMAEENGFIVTLGEWVLQKSCAQMRCWLDSGIKIGKMVVNVSPVQLLSSDFVSTFKRILSLNGLNPKCLELEITSSSLMNDSETSIRILNQLVAFGVDVTIGDFSTGCFSLNNLKRFPINKLKINSSFIFDALNKVDNEDIARSVIALGHSLHLQVIALGIESEAQKNQLLNLDCDEGQGYWFSPPVLPGEGIFRQLML